MDKQCHVEPLQKEATPDELADLQGQFLIIGGMGCPNCAARVRNSLLSLNGVVEVYVDHVSGQGYVVFNPKLALTSNLLEAVEMAGNDGHHNYWAEVASPSHVV